MTTSGLPRFVGKGGADAVREATGRSPDPWQPFEDGERHGADTGDHPEGYIANDDVVAAVNTALLLGKPLLLAGNPGTGKSQLADRIAWEFSLGAVLRFEAQSISEAQDLFYRFDLVGHMAQAHLKNMDKRPDPIEFTSFGPLGKSILRGALLPEEDDAKRARRSLLASAFGSVELESDWRPKRSVVLIDEIDKASRDFPNDLLNAIERLEFRIRELPAPGNSIRVAGESALRPIVIITSNGEREIPAPFLRRCVFCHIEDPELDMLRTIVQNRVFGRGTIGPLPRLYEGLLGVFDDFRKADQSFAYRPGTAELVDWSRAMSRQRTVKSDAPLDDDVNRALAIATSSAIVKNRQDREHLLELLRAFKSPLEAAGTS